MAPSWRDLCTEENKLLPSITRHVHRVEDKIVRINLAPGEKNFFGVCNESSRNLRLREENYRRASELINTSLTNSAVRVPRVIATEGDDITVWEYIDGIPLDEAWNTLAPRQKESIKLQIKEFIAQLWSIPTPSEFAIGSLCSTHELLCDNYHPHGPEYAESFWHNNGPYKTVREYYDVSQTLYYNYQPRHLASAQIASFRSRDCLYTVSDDGLATAKPVLDHQDWHQSNIIVYPNRDIVAGIIDWEYAAFVPDPEGFFMRGVSAERGLEDDWWSLFKGVGDIYTHVEKTRIRPVDE